MNDLATILAIPPQTVYALLRSFLLQNDTNRVCKPNRIMRRIGGEQEHLTFANVDIAKLPIIYSLEEHGSFILIEPFRCLIYMIIGPLIRAANDLQQISNEKVQRKHIGYHYCHIVIIDAIVIYRRLE